MTRKTPNSRSSKVSRHAAWDALLNPQVIPNGVLLRGDKAVSKKPRRDKSTDSKRRGASIKRTETIQEVPREVLEKIDRFVGKLLTDANGQIPDHWIAAVIHALRGKPRRGRPPGPGMVDGAIAFIHSFSSEGARYGAQKKLANQLRRGPEQLAKLKSSFGDYLAETGSSLVLRATPDGTWQFDLQHAPPGASGHTGLRAIGDPDPDQPVRSDLPK